MAAGDKTRKKLDTQNERRFGDLIGRKGEDADKQYVLRLLQVVLCG